MITDYIVLGVLILVIIGAFLLIKKKDKPTQDSPDRIYGNPSGMPDDLRGPGPDKIKQIKEKQNN